MTAGPRRRGSARLPELGRRSATAESHESRPVRGIRHLLFHERVLRELVAHGLTDGSGAAAVDHAHLGQAGEGRRVDKVAHGLTCLLGGAPAEVDLVGEVGIGLSDNSRNYAAAGIAIYVR